MPTRTEVVGFVKEVISEFQEDEGMSRAAALAYYTVFSLAPLLLIVIVIAGLFMSPQDASDAVNGQFKGLVGEEGAEQVRVMVEQVQGNPEGSIIARILGVIAVLLGATGVMVQLQTAMNRAWNVIPDPTRGGVKNFVTKRLLSFAMILAIAFLLLVSLVLTAALTAIATGASAMLPDGISAFSLEAINFGVSFIFVTALFAVIFKVMPEATIRWRDVMVGAGTTALLFTIGKVLIGLYLGQTKIATAYGTASSLAIIFVWVYYSSIILLLGAEFTQVWTRKYGGGMKPARGAVIAVHETRTLPSGSADPKSNPPDDQPDDAEPEGQLVGARKPTAG